MVFTKAERNTSPVDETFCYIREERRQVVNKIRGRDGVEISASFVAHNDFLALVQSSFLQRRFAMLLVRVPHLLGTL